MITEQQQELATRYALGELSPDEQAQFASQVRSKPELLAFLRAVQSALEQVALTAPPVAPPVQLKQKILARLRPEAATRSEALVGGLRFITGNATDWKPLPVPGTYLKLLSLQADRGYAVLLGKLDPGARYPAHTNAGPEDFYILTGDLHVGERVLGPGDFHHADAGSQHVENYSVAGCTLLAVLTTDDPLVSFARS